MKEYDTEFYSESSKSLAHCRVKFRQCDRWIRAFLSYLGSRWIPLLEGSCSWSCYKPSQQCVFSAGTSPHPVAAHRPHLWFHVCPIFFVQRLVIAIKINNWLGTWILKCFYLFFENWLPLKKNRCHSLGFI